MSTVAPVLKTPRELYREHLYDGLEAKKQTLFSGPLEGSEVVLWDDVRMIVNDRIPATSEHGAEVATPGRVVVFAVCPRCRQSAPIALEVTPELRVDASGGHLHIKGKSKPVYHVCGQLRAELDDGQESFELEDIVGEAIADAEASLDEQEREILTAVEDARSAADREEQPDDGMPGLACDWPRCRLSAGHSGAHKMRPATEAEDGSAS